MLYLTEYMSPLGKLSLVSDEENLKGLWIEGQKYFMKKVEKEGLKLVHRETEVLEKTRKWLDRYFKNRDVCIEERCFVGRDVCIEERCFVGRDVCIEEKYLVGRDGWGEGLPCAQELPLAPEGSEFQKLVWKNLCEIPYGMVTTYGELAAKIAVQMGRERMSAQAVGGAVGRNPISIIIPCHRVVGADGSLTGYAGGVEKKKWLLEWERC